jgi:hypothetical protein
VIRDCELQITFYKMYKLICKRGMTISAEKQWHFVGEKQK